MSMELPARKPGWKRIFLIRHGETFANEQNLLQGKRIDSSLNFKGKLQALQLREFFESFGYNFSHVFTSCKQRSIQTAEVSFPNVPSQRIESLDEMDYGDTWDGVFLVDLIPELRKLSKRWSMGETHIKCPNGESPEDVFARVKRAFDSIIRSGDSDTISAVVAHSFVNKILISQLKYGSIAHLALIKQDHCCINVIDFKIETDEAEIHEINFCKHTANL